MEKKMTRYPIEYAIEYLRAYGVTVNKADNYGINYDRYVEWADARGYPKVEPHTLNELRHEINFQG